MKKTGIVVSLVVAIVAVTLFNIFSKDKNEEVAISHKEYSRVDIETENTEVKILSANNESPKVELLENNRKYKLDVNVEGNTLEVEVKKKFFRLFDFGFFSPSPILKIYLPEKSYETLIVETDNGTIEGASLEVKEVRAITDNGDILFKDVKSDSLYSESDNGDVILENIDGEIIGQSDNGDLVLNTNHLDRTVNLETDNGNIRINTKKDPTNVSMVIETDNGDVKIFGQSHFNSVIGKGENTIKLTSDNGDITIEK